MIGICFIVIGLEGLLTSTAILMLNKKVKNLETEVKKINNPHNLNL